MTRHGFRMLAALLLPGTLAAQDAMPDDWTYRLEADQTLSTIQAGEDGGWSYTRMPPGWHITTTAQGVTLLPKEHTVEGRWGVEAEVFLFPNPSASPFGVVLEAADAPAPGSVQLQFLVRRDGQAALVARHNGEPEMIAPWTADTAATVHKGGVVKYVLRVMHEQGHLIFSVNGREMVVQPTGGEDHRAIPGLRVGPGLNLHVGRFELITPLAPARAR